MSIKYITKVFELTDIASGPKFVLLAIADQVNDDGWGIPGTRKLSRKTGLSRQTVSHHISGLEAAGMLTISERLRDNGGQTSNGYQLHLAPPEIATGVSEIGQPPQESATRPVLGPDTPSPETLTPPVGIQDTIEEPFSEPLDLTVNGTGREDDPAAALPHWFQYLMEIDGEHPALAADYPVARAWADRKGYSDELLEAVAEDLKAKWGTPQGPKRPWPYRDVRATFQKWCRLEAGIQAELPVSEEPKERQVGEINRPDAGIWAKALDRLEVQVTRPSFKTWLAGSVALGFADNVLVVEVGTVLAIQMLEQRMYTLIKQALEELGARNVEVSFVPERQREYREDAYP